MKMLKRALYLMAAVWAGCGLAIAAIPRFVLVNMFGQVPYPDYAYVRVAGALSFVLALLMVLVAQRLEEIWWFSWAFVVAAAATAAIAAANALGGRPDGSDAFLWWLFAGGSTAFTAGLLWGLAEAGIEKPPA